jgi:hypothetical protein
MILLNKEWVIFKILVAGGTMASHDLFVSALPQFFVQD